VKPGLVSDDGNWWWKKLTLTQLASGPIGSWLVAATGASRKVIDWADLNGGGPDTAEQAVMMGNFLSAWNLAKLTRMDSGA